MPGYTRYGNPWTNGSAPGISAVFLTDLENWIVQADNPAAVTLNGSTSGVATLYMPLQGTVWKYLIILLSTFRNGGGSNQTIALPTAFTTAAHFYTGSFPAFQLLASGSAQNVGVITTLGTPGNVTVTSTVGGYEMGDTAGGFDTISFNSGQASTHTGIAIFEGV